MEKMKTPETLQKAIAFAVEAHAADCRKGTDIPYIVHPMEVMKIVCGLTDDVDVRMAAVLHDTVEDTDATLRDIEEQFGSRVAELVAAESEDKRQDQPETDTWCIRKKETLQHLENIDRDAQIICLGDKLANLRDIQRDFKVCGEELWLRFNAPDDGKGIAGKKENIGWYYSGIARRLQSELGDTPAWKELSQIIIDVFQKTADQP